MLIRVDDFPSGSDSTPLPMDESTVSKYYNDVLKFYSIVRAPFLLGVVPGMLSSKWIEALQSLPDLELGVHGLTHRRGEFPSCAELEPKTMLSALTQSRMLMSTKVFVPPFNHLNNYLLRRLRDAGYVAVCTGPETDWDTSLDFYGMMKVDSTWYGHASEIHPQIDRSVLDMSDTACLTLHLPWEAPEGFVDLQYLMDKIKGIGVPIAKWSTVIGGLDESLHVL